MLRVGGSGGRHWVSIPSLLFSVIPLHLDFILSFGVVLAAAVLSTPSCSSDVCQKKKEETFARSPPLSLISLASTGSLVQLAVGAEMGQLSMKLLAVEWR